MSKEEHIPLVRRVRIRRAPSTEWEHQREEIRRNTAPHSRKSCGGCLGFYDQKGKLIRHPTIPMWKLL